MSVRPPVPRIAPARSGRSPTTVALPVNCSSASALRQRPTRTLELWSSKRVQDCKKPLEMANLHDVDSPTGPGPVNPPVDESGSSNGGSSNCRHHHTHRASSWLIILTNCSLCTNSKSREHTGPRSHISPTKDRQATAACLHNLHSLLCTTGAPQASRAVTHQGEAL